MLRRLAVVVLPLMVVAAACSSGDASSTTADPATTTQAPVSTTTVAPQSTTTLALQSTSTTTTTTVVDVATDAGVVQVPVPPQRVAALSAVFVEMLYAMGAGDQLIAGDLFSNYPPQAESLEKLDSFNLNLEAVIALDPDLVILSFDPGNVVAGLEAVGIPTLLFGTASSLDAAYGQMRSLGLATGHSDEAEAVVSSVQAGVDDVVARLDGAATGLSYYHESDPFTFYTPNSSSFIGQLYALLGMDNIADAAPDEFGGGFPQLSPEFIVASDPGVIFLASFGESAETVAAREGWDTMSAVKDGSIVVLDPDVASRWGPRVADLMRAIGEGIEGLVD